MSKRSHIIYAHPAQQDGYDFFYLYYYPGEADLYLRQRSIGGETQEFHMAPVPMLDWLERQAAAAAHAPSAPAWDAAVKTLRVRLRTWVQELERG